VAGPVEQVFVCDASAELDDQVPRSAIEVIMRSFAIARHGRARRDQERYGSDPRVIFLPRVVDHRRPLDFSGAEALIAAAYTSSRAFLAARPAVASASG